MPVPSLSKRSAPQTVLTLIENFERNLDAYRSGKYNETQVRRDFIDPLFKALGWDMDNSAGYAEAYRDVIHEDAIKIGTSTKAPDYSFRVGGQRKFFLEAKKPSVNVKDDVEPAFQLRRYAWSAKLPLSIVTDFEEFAIYDCRAKPDKGDKASKARLFYCTFRDYAEKWDEIAAIFSKEAVLKGSFDKYAGSNKGKRGTTEVDSAFLEEIEGWRDLLARNIALRNDSLSQRELNFAVQQTIDRIIFLRICEDRGIELYGRLMALQNGVNVYGRLRELFREADDRYNSGLFHFKREKGRAEAPDELTLNLEIDDKPLKEIFKNLYYPDCPYEFSVLGADILGSVYEQFLGKVIRLTAGNRAVVEDKPEVKKAGGVFYTPAYIVQYIVQHTVGKLLEGKTSKQAAGIAILDPACGSGSFLIGAYQYLLDWYLARYVEDGAEKHSKGKEARLRHSVSGEWRLTTSEKKRILLEHIYGVDIDAQAVEVTKLSLLLKVLEGESDQTLTSQMKLFHERVLPDLERNIQCGNSLIGPDFYHGQLDLDDEAAQRINVFDWQAAFPHIFQIPPNPPLSKGGKPQPPLKKGVERSGGGFDAVIGNPPYGATFGKSEKQYLDSAYSVAEGNYESFAFFLEKGAGLLGKKGLLGFIIPDTWFSIKSAAKLRKYVLEKGFIQDLQILNEHVFERAKVDVCTMIWSKMLFKKTIDVTIFDKNASAQEISANAYQTKKEILQSDWQSNEGYTFSFNVNQNSKKLVQKICNGKTALSDFCLVGAGCKPYELGKGTPPQTAENMQVKPYTANSKKNSTFRVMYRGSDIARYDTPTKTDEWLSYGEWLAAPRNPDLFSKPRLLFQSIRNPKLKRRLVGTYVDDKSVNNNSVTNIINLDSKYSLKYFLGILNSELMNWYFSVSYNIVNIDPRYLKMAPIQVDRTAHDKLVALVEKMLALHQQLAAAKTPQDTTLLQRQIAATDKQIDQLVYALYGLTDEEIALVEKT